MSVLVHGTHSTYSNLKCRCDACRAATAEYRRDHRRRRKAKGFIEPKRVFTPEQKARRLETTKQWREQNPDRVRELGRLGYQRNRGQRLAADHATYWSDPERARDRVKDYYRRNREEILDRQRPQRAVYRLLNREIIRERARQRHAANPEAKREGAAIYRARRLSAPRIEKIDRVYVVRRDKSMCHICGLHVPRDEIELDHLVPLVAGGSHTYDNLAVSHRFCNRSRGPGRIPAQLRLLG